MPTNPSTAPVANVASLYNLGVSPEQVALYDVARGAIEGRNMLIDGARVDRCEKRIISTIESLSGLAVPLSVGVGWDIGCIEIYVRAREGREFPGLAHRKPIAIIPAYEKAPASLVALLAKWEIPYVGILAERPILAAPAND